MQRALVWGGLVTSLVAITISVYAVGWTRSDSSTRSGLPGVPADVGVAIADLEERISKLEGTRDLATARASESIVERTRSRDDSASEHETRELQSRIEEIAARMSELEDVETMAAMVRSGEERLVRRERDAARLEVLDRSRLPGERLDALNRLDKPVRQDDEVLEAMCEIAMDTSLDGKVRTRAIESLWGFHDEGVKRDMLHILDVDGDPGVRGAALFSLYSHAKDPVVLDTIRTVADYDRHPGVQRNAVTLLSKLEWSENSGGDGGK